MAMYPCDFSMHRYREAQQTIYPALTDGGTTLRRKLRLCTVHFQRLLEHLEDYALNAQLSLEPSPSSRCLSCHNEVAGTEHAFFATVYASKSEREDYWAPVHDLCVAAVIDDWRLPATVDGEAS